MIVNEEEYFLKSFTEDDMEIFKNWLEKDYIQKWFDKECWVDQLNKRDNEYKDIKHFIFYHKDLKIGFCHYLDGFDAPDIYDNITMKNTSFEVNYFIGEEEFLRKGIGRLMIQKMEKMIKSIGGKELLADPEPENIVSEEFLLKCGFRKIKDGDFRKTI